MFVLQEVRRNGFGSCLVYGYDPKAEKTVYPSPWAQFFKDITNCQVRLERGRGGGGRGGGGRK